MRTPEDDGSQAEAELQAPPELVAALKRLPQERPFVPPTVDEAVFRAAQRHLSRPEKRPNIRLPMLRWLAAATAVVTVAFLAYHFLPTGAGPTRGRNLGAPRDFARKGSGEPGVISGQEPAPVRQDLTGERRGDILDALILARRLQSGPVRDARWDVNGDGVVDERDVQAIAVQVVRLDKGGGRS